MLLHSLPSSYLAIHSLVVASLLKTLLAHEFASLLSSLRHCRWEELPENHGENILFIPFSTILQP